MNKLKDIISPGHRELDDILYNNPKKTPSPQQPSPKRTSLSQRVRSVRHKDRSGSPQDGLSKEPATNQATAAAPPIQQVDSMPTEEYAIPMEATSKTEQIHSPQPIHPPQRLDTPTTLATPESELMEGQLGHVNSGRPTYLAATKQVPSEIASVASIKSGTVGYPSMSDETPTATPVHNQTAPGGFAGDNYHDTQPLAHNSHNRDWTPAGAVAATAVAGAGTAAYAHHQTQNKDNVHQNTFEANRDAPITSATYSPTNHSDNFTHPTEPVVDPAPASTGSTSRERPFLMPGTYVSENDVRHNYTGPASHTAGPHKSNIANILDPRVKPELGTGKYVHDSGSTATDPATKTIGPHDSNVANIIDPRVKPEPEKMKGHYTTGPHQSDMLNRVDPKVDSNPASGFTDREGTKPDHHGRNAAIAAGAAGLAGAGAYQASRHHHHMADQREGYERQNSPYSSAPLDPRVDTAGHGSRNYNTMASPTDNGQVSPMAPGFQAAGTAPTYPSGAQQQYASNANSSPSISPISEQDNIVPGHHDPSVAVGHSRFDSVHQNPQSYTDSNEFMAGNPEMAAMGGVDAARHYSRRSLDKADKEYRQEYSLYQKDLAREKAAEEKGLETERRGQEKQLAKEQKLLDKDLAKSQKEHTKQMQKEAKQIQKEIERQENGGKKKRRSGLFGFLHKDKHAHDTDATSSGDASLPYRSSSEDVGRTSDVGQHERNRLVKQPPTDYH